MGILPVAVASLDWSAKQEILFLVKCGETIVEHLRDYSIDYIRTRCLDVINNQYKTVSQQARDRMACQCPCSEQKHCFVFSDTAIMIAQETGYEDDWQE